MQPVYMYHAVGSGTELQGADPHYAVAAADFARHLVRIGRSLALAAQRMAGRRPSAPAVTFDDGHRTNYSNAFPALVEAGMQAEFYVNSALVGRDGFVTWAQLAEMADAGMSIQSHGDHHLFFADLDDRSLETELERSKKTIEDRLGLTVTVLAPPGGRFDRRTVEKALSLGYRALAVSRPGLWTRTDALTVPRFPIYAHTGEDTVARYKSPRSADTLRAVARYRAARIGQTILGNRRYDGLRNSMLGAGEGRAA
ncbi:MAG: polysaccharide deacetylase family protein [Alphaproteobacteria bacterium]